MIFVLYFLLFLVILLSIILFFPVTVVVSHKNSFHIYIKFIFIKIPILGSGKIPFKVTKNANLNFKTDTNLDDTSLLKKINLAFKSVKLVYNHSKKIFKHMKINIGKLKLVVKGENAADTAIKCGKLSILVCNIFGFLASITDLELGNIEIYPDFLEKNELIEFDLSISSRLIFILYEFMIFSQNYAKILDELNLE